MPSTTVQVMPDMRIIHPERGDITTGVARALAQLREQRNREDVEAAAREQALIQRAHGNESRIGKHGLRLIAQIDDRVFNYWEAREGREFWQHELPFMLKRHPELAVKPVRENPIFGYRGPVRGKRGRWAA